jgi:hypothetical protein
MQVNIPPFFTHEQGRPQGHHTGFVEQPLRTITYRAMNMRELRAMDAGRTLWPDACGRLIYGSASHIPEPHASHAIEGWKYLLT